LIALSEPNLTGLEKDLVNQCLETGWISTSGSFVGEFEEAISEYCNSQYAIACINGTSGLHVSLKLSGVERNTEVLVPTLTFAAPVNAIIYNNAFPVFFDVDKYHTLNVEQVINFLENETYEVDKEVFNTKTDRKISCILPVHTWGNICDVPSLKDYINKRDISISIVEDASESLGSKISVKENDIHSGTLGDFGVISFNGNKIITAGGGGIILTNNQKKAEEAKHLISQAKKDPIRYVHDKVGFNYGLTNIQAALGLGQFKNLESFIKRKQEIHKFYNKEVSNINGLSILEAPENCTSNYWLNILKIEESFKRDREELMAHLKSKSIETRPIWFANHLQEPYKDFQSYEIDLAVNEIASCLCIPSSTNLSNEDLFTVVTSINE
jgi:perosamine synthetase